MTISSGPTSDHRYDLDASIFGRFTIGRAILKPWRRD
jgi:hypothetical protein